MKLVASLMVGPNEQERYLAQCLESLATYCDEIRIRLEGYGDKGDGWFHGTVGLCPIAIRRSEPTFFRHEGRARQELLDWTLEADPTHILSIDADEFVADPDQLRAALEQHPEADVLALCMEEVWKADQDGYRVRCDGGWCPHEVPVLYRVPRRPGPEFRIQDRALACGREPVSVRRLARHAVYAETALLHFGWTREAERASRHERYAVADGGKFHAGSHLASILWPDAQVTLEARPRPPLDVYDEIVARAAAG